MAYISYGKLWRKAFYRNFSAEDRAKDTNPNKFKLKVNDKNEKHEKILTNFDHSNPNLEGIITKLFLDTTLSEVECQILYIEKSYSEDKDVEGTNKQSGEVF